MRPDVLCICHSEEQSDEESRQQETEASEYGILHCAQDDSVFQNS